MPASSEMESSFSARDHWDCGDGLPAGRGNKNAAAIPARGRAGSILAKDRA
jgi:hypothetical protein